MNKFNSLNIEIFQLYFDAVVSSIKNFESRNFVIKGKVFLNGNNIFGFEDNNFMEDFRFNSISKLHEIYNQMLDTNDRWNTLEFNFFKNEEPKLSLTWDQEYYDKRMKEAEKYIKHIDNKIENLPKPEVRFNIDNLNIENAYSELNKCVFYPNDENWDGAYYTIKRIGSQFITTCEMYMYTSLERKKLLDADTIEFNLEVTEPMEKIFSFIQEYYLKENPSTPFNALFITVHKDGRFIKNFEFNGEEVSPDAEPIPEVMTKEYLLQNLYGCITANTPDKFEFVWEEISRSKQADGKVAYSAKFCYSLNSDESEPQIVAPGEFTYMINVSVRLFDEFLPERTKNWSKIKVRFSEDGKPGMQVMERQFDENFLRDILF